MKKLALTFLLVCVGITNSYATNYWVSPTGNDANNGLDSTTAWAKIDRGDDLSILVAGDTVKLMPGMYTIVSSASFDQSVGFLVLGEPAKPMRIAGIALAVIAIVLLTR